MRIRKLFYVPGLISIIGLPVLLFFMGPEDEHQTNVLPMYIPTDKKDSIGIERFSKEGVYEAIKGKKIVRVNLDFDRNDYDYGDGYDERNGYNFYRKLSFITHEIETLQFANDTSTILKVKLGYFNTYGDFIWLYNLARIYKLQRYALVDNNFYFLANPPFNDEPLTFDIEPEALNLPKLEPYIPSQREIFHRYFTENYMPGIFMIRQNYIYVIGLFLLIVFPAIKKIRRNLTYSFNGSKS